jgi:hypothetical protein
MKPKLPFCIVVVLGSLFARVTNAQPVAMYRSSLEAMFTTAQSVVRGSITNYSRSVISAPWTNFVKGVTSGPRDGVYKYNLTVEVDEVLKGPPRKAVQLEAEMQGFQHEIEQWNGRHTSLLVFVNGSRAGSQRGSAVPGWRVIPLEDAAPAQPFTSVAFVVQPPVQSMDLSWVTVPRDILSRVRAFAKERFDSTNTCWVEAWGMVYLEVPLSPSLEKIAQRLVTSKDERITGIRELRYFKSAKNIKLLKPLLNDPGSYETSVQNCPWIRKQVYPTREEAYKVLKEWGVAVSEPVTIRKQVYPTREEAYKVLKEWGVAVSEPVTEVRLPWQYDPAVRQKLDVQYPTRLWVRRGPTRRDGTTNAFEMGADYATVKWTNVLVGSNMLAGTKFDWFVYPEGTPRPATPTRTDRCYWPTAGSTEEFELEKHGLPAPGQTYTVESVFTLFETDKPPPEIQDSNGPRADLWRPEEGERFQILLQQTLSQTGQ